MKFKASKRKDQLINSFNEKQSENKEYVILSLYFLFKVDLQRCPFRPVLIIDQPSSNFDQPSLNYRLIN